MTPLSDNPLYQADVLRSIYRIRRGEPPLVPVNTYEFQRALWWLRKYELVEWGPGYPQRVLTTIGEWLVRRLEEDASR